jgi:hypothetical protein
MENWVYGHKKVKQNFPHHQEIEEVLPVEKIQLLPGDGPFHENFPVELYSDFLGSPERSETAHRLCQ